MLNYQRVYIYIYIVLVSLLFGGTGPFRGLNSTCRFDCWIDLRTQQQFAGVRYPCMSAGTRPELVTREQDWLSFMLLYYLLSDGLNGFDTQMCTGFGKHNGVTSRNFGVSFKWYLSVNTPVLSEFPESIRWLFFCSYSISSKAFKNQSPNIQPTRSSAPCNA